MKRLLAVMVVALGLAALPAQAATVVVNDYVGGNFDARFGSGGPFNATIGGNDFVTFCIEENETFSFGATYDYTLDANAIDGGNGNAGTYAGDVNGGSSGDPVSEASMWLYTQIILGTLPTGGLLPALGPSWGSYAQEAFWYLENERTSISATAMALADEAIANAGNWGTLYNQGHRVYAMNLTGVNKPTELHQSMLYHEKVQVPEPASMLLFGLGLLGVATRIRR